MRLKPRLAALADLIPRGRVVADIGTDHAFLPIYLIDQGLAPKVIAVENRLTTFSQAQRSLSSFHSGGKIDLRLGDGLSPLKKEDGVQVVVIAGMGGRTICRMLREAEEKWPWFDTLILQPVQEVSLLRRWLIAHNFRFTREQLIKEGKRIYEIAVVRRGRQPVFNPLLYEVGPCLMRDGDPLLTAFLEQKIKRCRRIIQGLLEASGSGDNFKEAYYREQESRLKEALALVGKGRENNQLS